MVKNTIFHQNFEPYSTVTCYKIEDLNPQLRDHEGKMIKADKKAIAQFIRQPPTTFNTHQHIS